MLPVPTPNDGDISSCISALKHEDPSLSNEQAAAICYSKQRGEAMHPDFQRILLTFMDYFKDGTALEQFNTFIANNGLDIAKEYHPLVQFNESLAWTKPLIRFIKKDKDAKYYGVRALTANISMNNNDYRDYQMLVRAAPSMKVKPVNYNHDPSRWLPFPRTRVDMVGMEDLAMELILRVDNLDRYFQMQLDHDPSIPEGEWINHPSIQGYGNNGEIEYLGCAFLERSVQLPGDPLSNIVPLILNENVRSKLCKIVDGILVCETGVNKIEKLKKIMSEQQEKDVWIHNCIQQGHSREECEAQWTAKQEQMTETPPETTEMSEEERAFMDECTSGGKSTEECALEWQHKLGAAQPPATTIPPVATPTGPLQQDEPAVTPLEPAPLPATEPPVADLTPPRPPLIPPSIVPSAPNTTEQLEQPATVEPDPPLSSEYPTDSQEAFMTACLAANANDADYCTNLWQQVKTGIAEEPFRVDRATKETEMLRLSERNVQLQAELGAKATHEVTLLNENANLRDQLSVANKTRILYDAEKEHNRLLKSEVSQLRDHIKSKDVILNNTKDRNVIELKERIDQVRRLERKVEAKDVDVRDLEEQVDKLSIHGTRLRRDVSQLTATATKDNERARSAVKDRSEVQIENANLRDEASRLTRQISNLTAQIGVKSKKVYALEQRGLKLTEAIAEKVESDGKLRKQLKAMGNRMKKMWNELNKQGIYWADEQGNVTSGISA